MEEHLNPLAVTHLLQHTLRSLCLHENSQWVYAVFWRILPRNYPPPKWEAQGAYERSRGNRRNWILVWEDGFCNFAKSTAIDSSDCPAASSGTAYGDFPQYQGLQPELFFKMSHEIYNYGEGLIGKVAADYSHKWIYKEPNEQEINFLSAWHNSADSHPRTWEAQFQSGIKTIALIAVREGVVQLGAVQKVIEDLNYVVLLRKRFSYIESIPGVLLPHPSSSSAYPMEPPDTLHYQGSLPPPAHQFYDPFNNQPLHITPSMSSLEALLSKLPSVVPPPDSEHQLPQSSHHQLLSPQNKPLEFMGMGRLNAKEEIEDEYQHRDGSNNAGESSSSTMQYYHHSHDLSAMKWHAD